MDVQSYAGPILVTVACFVLWYGLLLVLQRGTKYRLIAEYAARGAVFDRYFGQDAQMLAADRAVANTHEQMGPFVVSLWLHARFVSPTTATALGAAYVGLRIAYPFLLGRSLTKTNPKRVFLVTGPCYAIIAWLLGGVAYAAIVALGRA